MADVGLLKEGERRVAHRLAKRTPWAAQPQLTATALLDEENETTDIVMSPHAIAAAIA
jgi:hypothetical protein